MSFKVPIRKVFCDSKGMKSTGCDDGVFAACTIRYPPVVLIGVRQWRPSGLVQMFRVFDPGRNEQFKPQHTPRRSSLLWTSVVSWVSVKVSPCLLSAVRPSPTKTGCGGVISAVTVRLNGLEGR